MARRTLLIILTGLALLVAAGCGGGNGSVPADAVAVVDGEDVPRTQYDSLIAQAKKTYTQDKRDFPKAGTAERKQLDQQAVAFLVQRVELAQAAEELGVEVTDKDVEARLDQIKKQYFGGDEKRYAKQLKQQGLTDEQVRRDVRANVISEKVFNEVTKDVKVSDADVKKYYDDNKAQYGTPESRDVRHILVAKTKKAGGVDFPASKVLADQLYTQLKGGADFAKLAKQYSQDPGSKDQGGKYTVVKGQTVAPFEQTAFLLETKQISRPVRTQYGYHIIQPLSEAKPAKTQPLNKTLKDQIRNQLQTQKRNEKMNGWVKDLEKRYEDKVDYATGFEPPATSSSGSTSTSK
jgi:peptidyl-prolyl cis-trans isomerase C